MSNRSEVHTFAAFVHGALTAFHTLGLVYNIKRRNRFDTVAHALGIIYSTRAAVHHARLSDLSTRIECTGMEIVRT